jgi:hypothetical protein
MKNRQIQNKALLKILECLIEENPDARFSQLLENYEFVSQDNVGTWKDEFYLEPGELLKRVSDSLEKFK